MNKLQKLINSLEDNYKVKVDEIVKSYADKKSVEAIADEQSVTPYVISTVLKHLQLKRPKNKRDTCVKEHYAMLENESLDHYTEELEEENDKLLSKVSKLEKSLINSRFELTLKRKEQRNITRQESFEDRVLSVLSAQAKRPLVNVKPKFNIHPNYETDEGLCIVLSDHHIGEVVGDDVLQNTYNYSVAIKRLEVLLESLLTFPKQSKNITVIQCGDILKGLIHGGIHTTEGSFVESISKAVDYNVYMYTVLANVYDKVTIRSITGNHDRVTEYPSINNKSLDFTRLVDKMVAKNLDALGINNVEIIATDIPYQLFEINNANILAFHGDTVRKYNPADAGQRSLVQDLCLGTFKVPYRHAVSGHTHQFMACHNQYNGTSIVNGSLVGSNAYGVTNGMRDITPTQTIFFVGQNGDIEFIKAVNLS